MMSSSTVENVLEEQLVEVGEKLQKPPEEPDQLLPLLEVLEDCLGRVEQSPSKSMTTILCPSMNMLVSPVLLKHSDKYVRLSVATCLSEVTRITAPDAPYDDDLMKEIFKLIVTTFEDLSDAKAPYFSKSVLILETVAKVRSCVVMLDLECDDLILEMFGHFIKTIREDHAECVFSSMEGIMTVVLEESEEIPSELLTLLLNNSKPENEQVSPVARWLVEKVMENCAAKLKPYLLKALKASSISTRPHNKPIAKICEGAVEDQDPAPSGACSENLDDGKDELVNVSSADTSEKVEQQEKLAQIMVEDDKSTKTLSNGSLSSKDDSFKGGSKDDSSKEYCSPPKEYEAVCLENGATSSEVARDDDNQHSSIVEAMSDQETKKANKVETKDDRTKKASKVESKDDAKKASKVETKDDATKKVSKVETEDNATRKASKMETKVDKTKKPMDRTFNSLKSSSDGSDGAETVLEDKTTELPKSKRGRKKNIEPLRSEGANSKDVNVISESEKEIISEPAGGDSAAKSQVHDSSLSKRQGKVAARSRDTKTETKPSILPVEDVGNIADGTENEDLPDIGRSKGARGKVAAHKGDPKPGSEPSVSPVGEVGALSSDAVESSPLVAKKFEKGKKRKRSAEAESDPPLPKKDATKDDENIPLSKSLGRKVKGIGDKIEDQGTVESADKKSAASKKSARVAVKELGDTSIKSSTIKKTPGRRLTPKDETRGSTERVKAYDESLVGSQIKVYWPLDKKFYKGKIVSFDPVKKKHNVSYADGDEEELLLSKERWEHLDVEKPEVGHSKNAVDVDSSAATPPLKKRMKTSSSASKGKDVDDESSVKKRREAVPSKSAKSVTTPKSGSKAQSNGSSSANKGKPASATTKPVQQEGASKGRKRLRGSRG